MSFESDGVGEVVEDHFRTMMLIAVRVAQHRTQARAEAMRQAAAESTAAAAREQARQQAQMRAASQSMERVNSSVWWDHADAQDIGEAWSTAQQYRGETPWAERAHHQMADEIKDRYGLDVHDVDVSSFGQQTGLPERTAIRDEELRAYDRQLVQLRAEYTSVLDGPSAERAQARISGIDEARDAIREELAIHPDPALDPTGSRQALEERRELAQTVTITGGSDEAGYDTPLRRQKLVDELQELTADRDVVDAVALADVTQAKPATGAVSASSSASRPPARAARPKSKQLQRRH
jgi:hypothetical protein